jgi:PilZ domain-containing protein
VTNDHAAGAAASGAAATVPEIARASAPAAVMASRTRDRRVGPRVPANLPVLIMSGALVVVGSTADASEEGLAVTVPPSSPELPPAVRVALRLPTSGWHEVEGQIVRRQPLEGGSALLGIRLPGRTAAVARPPAPSARARAAERRPGRLAAASPARSLGAELRALASLIYEQAFHDPAGRPLPSLVAWAGRLAAGLGVVAAAPASNRDLLSAVAALHRRWSAAPLTLPARTMPRAVSGRPSSRSR